MIPHSYWLIDAAAIAASSLIAAFHRRLRERNTLHSIATIAIIIAYVAAVAGAAVGFLTARVFQVGDRCPPGGRRPS